MTLPNEVRQAIRDTIYFRSKRIAGEPQNDRAMHQFEIEEADEMIAALTPLWPSADGRGKAAREWAAYAKPDSAQSHVRNLVSDILNANTLEDAEAAGRAFLERIISETKQAMDRLSTPSPVAGLPTPETDAFLRPHSFYRQAFADFARSLELRLAAARAEVEALQKHRDDFQHAYRAKCDVETKELHTQLATAKAASQGDRDFRLAVEEALAKEAGDTQINTVEVLVSVLNERDRLRSDLAKANAAVEEAKQHFCLTIERVFNLPFCPSYFEVESIAEKQMEKVRAHHAAKVSDSVAQLAAQQSVPPAETPEQARQVLEDIVCLRSSVPPEARAVAKGNRAKIAVVMELTDAILADVKEKNQMIDAEETHGAEWGEREDDFGEAQQILEELQGPLNRLDYLL